MLIARKEFPSKTYFCDVKIGEVFCVSCSPNFYLKTEDFENEDRDTCYNAVNLESGGLALFSDNDKVDILKATLMIE